MALNWKLLLFGCHPRLDVMVIDVCSSIGWLALSSERECGATRFLKLNERK